jgi:hypothetical protein
MPAARGIIFVALCASSSALGCPSARPAETGGVHQTFEIADVGGYTGGWTGQEAGGAAGEKALPPHRHFPIFLRFSRHFLTHSSGVTSP